MTDQPETTATLGEALPREITRVRNLQGQYKSLRGMNGVMVEPQIAMMEHEIQVAVKACAAGDLVRMIRSYQSLKDYTS